MAVYDDILIPTDGSEPAARAAAHGVDIAARYGATVHAVHVLGMVFSSAGSESDPDIGLDAPWADIQRGAEAAAGHLTDAVVERCEERGVDVERAVLRGIAADRLLDYVDEHGIDLVAMGTHGRRGLARFVIGSVTERLVRAADASVLTVGPDADVDGGYETVLVGVDGREHTAVAVEQAVAIAERYGAAFHAVNAVAPARPGLASLEERRREIGEEALEDAVAAAADRGVAATGELREGHPHEELAAAAEEHGADLAVVGAGRRGLAEILLGDVTEKVVRTVEVPVLTAKPLDD